MAEIQNDIKNNKDFTIKNNQNIIFVNNDINNKLFHDFVIYLYKSLKNKTIKKIILGVDLEFNSKIIALIQLNFYYDGMETIFIIDPNRITDKTKKILIKRFFINKKIKKILHGADTLDIPRLITNIFNKDKYIKKFIKSYIDTKFLCEAITIKNNTTSKLCNYYDLIYNFNIIDKNKFDYLFENQQNIGPIKDVYIDINRLSNNLKIYVMYDVVYLIDVYKYLRKELKKNLKLINEINQLIMFERFNIYFTYNKYKTRIDESNINFIKYNNKNILLNNIFNNNINNFLKYDKYFEYIFKINNFKKYLVFYFKIITFYVIKNKYRYIYIKKDNISNTDYKDIYMIIFKQLNDDKFKNIKKIFNKYYNFINNNLFINSG